jgi:hypothetical protein
MNFLKKLTAQKVNLVYDSETKEFLGVLDKGETLKDFICDFFNNDENTQEHFFMWKSVHCEDYTNEKAFIAYYNEVLKPRFVINTICVAKE